MTDILRTIDIPRALPPTSWRWAWFEVAAAAMAIALFALSTPLWWPHNATKQAIAQASNGSVGVSQSQGVYNVLAQISPVIFSDSDMTIEPAQADPRVADLSNDSRLALAGDDAVFVCVNGAGDTICMYDLDDGP